MWRAAVLALALMLGACAARLPVDGGGFDDSFDPSWMTVIPVDRSSLSGFCVRQDRQSLLGCARPYNDSRISAPIEPGGDGGERLRADLHIDAARSDALGGRGSCIIYVARDLVRDSATFDYVLRHEAMHCRGWRHPGD